MMKKILLLFPILLIIGLAASAQTKMPDKKNLMHEMPLLFTENKGQITDKAGKPRPDIVFTANSGNTGLFLSHTGIYYQFTKIIYPEGYTASIANHDVKTQTALAKRREVQTHRFSLELAGANEDVVIRKEDKSATTYNFYPGNTPEGVTGADAYKKVVYENVYPHIDWVIYSMGKGLKYDFVVHPGGDPSQIRLNIKDAEKVSITEKGELLMQTKLGEIREDAPSSFADGKQVPSRFKQNSDGTIGFDVTTVPGTTLTIDPVVMWSTYYGGNQYDIAQDCSVDSLGYVYVTGYGASTTAIANGGFQNSIGGNNDAFLAKFNASGTLIWATYYGGAQDDYGFSCAADRYGNILVSGDAYSTNIASGGFQNVTYANAIGGAGTIYLVKFNAATGMRLWATYYGTASAANSNTSTVSGGFKGVDADKDGNIYLTGYTNAPDVASGGYQNTFAGGIRDAFLVKFNAAGNRVWATYYGGNAEDIGRNVATDDSGNVYLSGQTASTSNIASGGVQNTYGGGVYDAFLVKFNSAGTRVWASYYGGNQAENSYRCLPDSAGNVYLMGQTSSTANIASGGAQNTFGGGIYDAFLVKFNTLGTVILWGTYFGGTGQERFSNGIIDYAGNVIATGFSGSSGLANGGFQNTLGSSFDNDAILAKFNPAGGLVWSSYFGGADAETGNGCAVDSLNNIYMVGGASSSAGISIPGTHQPVYGGSNDGFLVKVGNVNLITGTTITGPFCAGSAVSVPYTISGIYNASNVFTAQLSNASGSFAAPVNIGTFVGTTGGSINATIPLNTPPGTGYRIRVVSSSPVIIAPNNGTNLVIAGASSITTVTDTVCSNDLPYIWHGVSVTAGGTAVASDTITNAGGCDSILLLNLVVKTAPTPLIVHDTTCRNNLPVIWNGITVNAPPTGNIATVVYTDTAANLCDSVVTLQLFIRDTSAVTDHKTYCRNVLPVVWNGITIPATANSNPNYATFNTVNAGGCDSIVKLNLTVNEVYAVSVNDTVCSNQLPITWNGISVPAPSSGNTTTAVYNTQSVHSCDSIVTLHLFIKHASAHTVDSAVCSNQMPITWNGTTVTTGGPAAAVYTTPNAVNCDSVVTLNLTVHNTSAYTQAITICNNQLPYTWNGIIVTSGGTGIAVYTTDNTANCDSVVTLNLTVKDTSASTENITICASELPYTWNGIVVTSGGPAAAVYDTQNVVGCDSVVTLNLNVTTTILPTITVTVFPGSTIPNGTPATFTATITNGGTAPVLQWQKNGINVGTNSATYTDFDIDSADVITCVLTSSIVCAFPNDVTSNPVTMVVVTPPPPCLVPVTLISTDIQFSSAVFKWAHVAAASGYEVVLDLQPTNPTSGMFTTDTVYHASAMLPGVHYFHIRTRCTNGDYSPWITITITIQDGNGSTGTADINANNKELTLYPNPNNGIFNVIGTVSENKAGIDIIDRSGRIIYRNEAATPDGKLNHRIHLSDNLAAGIYLLRVTSGYEVYVIRFVHE
ncbi:T9SS type A sorting domain-containing protein [Taibaiella lutea]|uniref:T9SS type A sorting domain-containing protein n=1 Tax=Taibaiella lutea TaxID=2608001 RepID=A0A5M6CN27_9BACT|nr:SBBP repeat-containing protein [Taibaiella lutea]KAA5534549.1 T9SS type A sorting domain-containing protein [Taibaiella lutea]